MCRRKETLSWMDGWMMIFRFHGATVYYYIFTSYRHHNNGNYHTMNLFASSSFSMLAFVFLFLLASKPTNACDVHGRQCSKHSGTCTEPVEWFLNGQGSSRAITAKASYGSFCGSGTNKCPAQENGVGPNVEPCNSLDEACMVSGLNQFQIHHLPLLSPHAHHITRLTFLFM